MGKDTFIFFLLGLLILASCSPFFIVEKPCTGPEVDSWFEDTYPRIERINTDSSLTSSEIRDLYQLQQQQLTHICMAKAQQFAEEYFLHQVNAAEAVEKGKLDDSLGELMLAKVAYNNMVDEITRLAEEYKWEK